MRRHVCQLAEEIGERNVQRRPGELAQAADYVQAEFAGSGGTVRRQEYPVRDVVCANIELELPGRRQAQEIIVVGAHYDSVVGSAGANDNGSGVAALLCLGTRCAQETFDRTLRFVAFANEEAPFFQTEAMGSWVYARRCRQRNEQLVAMMSLETIGYYTDQPGTQNYPVPFAMLYPSTGNFIGFVANTASAGLLRDLLTEFRRCEPFPAEGGAFPAFVPGVGFSDQWSFWQEGYPGVMITDTAMYRYPFYHLPEDTADKIDFDRLARVVRGLHGTITVLANRGSAPGNAPATVPAG